MTPGRIQRLRHAAALAKSREGRRGAADSEDSGPSEDQIDESLEETFPASDPPSWMAGTKIGSPK
jgi:hypothetical protein